MAFKYLNIIFIFSLGIFGFGRDEDEKNFDQQAMAPIASAAQGSAGGAAPALTEQQKKANKQLTHAAKTNNVKLAEQALAAGADINVDISDPLITQTPIFWAIHANNKDIAKFLIRRGAIKSLKYYNDILIERYNRTALVAMKQELIFAKEVIDELIKEQTVLSSEESAQSKKDISLAADLPTDIANLIASYTYSMPKEDLEKLKQLSREIKKSIGEK